MPANPLRNIPSVSDLLDSPPLRGLVGRLNTSVLASRARMVLDEVLSEMQTAASGATLPSVTELAERIAHRLREDPAQSPRPTINATGVLLHPELGIPPLADAALAEARQAGLNYLAATTAKSAGAAASYQAEIASLLHELTGCESALVVNSQPAARLLTVAATSAGKQVVIARAHTAEAADGSRIGDSTEPAGAVLKEIGAANVTHLDEYRAAISEQTGVVWYAEPVDHQISGLAQQATLDEVTRVAHDARQLVVHELALGGAIEPLPSVATAGTTARASIQSGADIVLLRGEGLLGGPRAGIVLARRELIRTIQQHHLFRAVQADKITLALLAATLRLQLQPELARREIPLWRLLDTPLENLRLRAHRLAEQIGASRMVRDVRAVGTTTYLSGVAVAAQQIDSWSIELAPRSGTVETLAEAMRLGNPSAVARVGEQALQLDLRAVLPRQDQELVRAITALEQPGTSDSGRE